MRLGALAGSTAEVSAMYLFCWYLSSILSKLSLLRMLRDVVDSSVWPRPSVWLSQFNQSAMNHPTSQATQLTYQGCATYRGILAGWQPVGSPRNYADTQRLLSLLNRIRPDFINRIQILPL